MNKKIIVVVGCLLLLAGLKCAMASPTYNIILKYPIENIEIRDVETLEQENFTVTVFDDQEVIRGDIVATYDGYEVVIGKMYGVLYR